MRPTRSFRNDKGFTLIELLIAVGMFTMVFLGAAAVYISALNFFEALAIQKSQVAPLFVIETIQRDIAKAREIYSDTTNLKIRVIPDQEHIFDKTADSWVVYSLVTDPDGNLRLRSKGDTLLSAIPGACTTSDPEVQIGLIFKTGSQFVHTAGSPLVTMNFIAEVGRPPKDTNINTQATAGYMTNKFETYP